jgi:hypothetical protein
MRIELINDTKLEKLCSGFSLLEEKDKVFILGVLEGLLFANEKIRAIGQTGLTYENQR